MIPLATIAVAALVGGIVFGCMLALLVVWQLDRQGGGRR